MTLMDACELMKKYTYCPNCGSEYIGSGAGTLEIDTKAGYFKRTCACGWKVEIQEERVLIPLDVNFQIMYMPESGEVRGISNKVQLTDVAEVKNISKNMKPKLQK